MQQPVVVHQWREGGGVIREPHLDGWLKADGGDIELHWRHCTAWWTMLYQQHTSGQHGVWQQNSGCSQSASKERETGSTCGVIEILGKLVHSTSAHLWIWSVPVPGAVASRQQCRCFAVLARQWSHISQRCQRSPELFVRPSNVDVVWETVFICYWRLCYYNTLMNDDRRRPL